MRRVAGIQRHVRPTRLESTNYVRARSLARNPIPIQSRGSIRSSLLPACRRIAACGAMVTRPDEVRGREYITRGEQSQWTSKSCTAEKAAQSTMRGSEATGECDGSASGILLTLSHGCRHRVVPALFWIQGPCGASTRFERATEESQVKLRNQAAIRRAPSTLALSLSPHHLTVLEFRRITAHRRGHLPLPKQRNSCYASNDLQLDPAPRHTITNITPGTDKVEPNEFNQILQSLCPLKLR